MDLFISASDMSADQVQSFKDWARANYAPLQPISGLWHPIVQAECTLINQEVNLSILA
jgi:hypothetical protein